MSILITGSEGCSGSALAGLLSTRENKNNIYLSDISDVEKVNYFRCDLSDADLTLSLIKRIRPKEIYHLAGAFTNDFLKDFQANVLTTRNLIESIAQLGLSCRILLVGSAAEYGQLSALDLPVSENHSLLPTTNYGLTKKYQTELMHFYVRTKGSNLVMARTFNIKAKNLSPKLFIGRLYQQIEHFKAGHVREIRTGDLSASRDYLDVSEVVNAYVKIMKKGVTGEIYNVGSGFPTKMEDLLNQILKEESVDRKSIVMEQADPSNTSTARKVYADISKLNQLS